MCLAKEDLADKPMASGISSTTPPPSIVPPSDPSLESRPTYWPFANPTIKAALAWLNNGNTRKSESELDAFVEDVINSPTFDREHLKNFKTRCEKQRLDKAMGETAGSHFQEVPVKISVPSGDAKTPPKDFDVPGLLYRSLTSVIKEAFTGTLGHLHHFSPYKRMYTSPLTKKETRIYDEIYTSDAFMETHEDVQRHAPVPPDDPECKREKVVAALMFSSDATHLTSFGNAKAWPIYLMLGNLSKYIRGKPNSGGVHHLAYIPSVRKFALVKISLETDSFEKIPDSFQDFGLNFCHKWRTNKDAIMTHCRRDLIHAVWEIILDEEFVHAYKYGMVVKCSDGVERRLYPRIFTYSADYPEK